MAIRFVEFVKDGGAVDYTVNGFDFKYLDLSGDGADKIMAQASEYYVKMEKIERYTHEEYGSYEDVEEEIYYELTDLRSISEKIWTKEQGCGDIIVDGGEFFGVVFFTGFTDYREEEELGFVPLEHIDSRENLTRYCCVEFSILERKGVAIPQAYRKTEEDESPSGRSSTSWKTNYYLIKK